MKTKSLSLASALAWAALLVALPSLAQYKVVGPDGKITYTDRPPPVAGGNRVTPVRSGEAGAATEVVALPIELREAAQRYPVTLYTVADCEPCDSGRSLLRSRGIPFGERQVISGEDSDALQRIAGSRDVPILMIGAQAMRGLSAEAWNSYLDSAGYPRESRLPANYQFPAPVPVTERRQVAVPSTPAPAAAPAQTPDARPADPANPGIRF